MDPENSIRAARRKVELSEEIGTEEVRCIYCGNTDSTVVRLRRIQKHHPFGHRRDPLTNFACLNCHAVAHECLRDADVPMIQEKEPRIFAKAVFRALAVHFTMLAKACRRFASRME
jgi:hypothetical protein